MREVVVDLCFNAWELIPITICILASVAADNITGLQETMNHP